MTPRHPRAHESTARAAQLERLKEERRRKRNGDHIGRRLQRDLQEDESAERRRRTRTEMLLETPDKAPRRPHSPTPAQLLAEIQRIAMGGVMPTADRYDYARSRSFPPADRVCQLLGIGWEAIAAELGLRMRAESLAERTLQT